MPPSCGNSPTGSGGRHGEAAVAENGANKAAVRLARLGRPVKEMIGGVLGWAAEGFAFAEGRNP